MNAVYGEETNSYEQEINKKIESIAGTFNDKFSLYNPTYFIFGRNDLKLQFSFKYRLAKSVPVYFGFTQTMFWNIYDGSKPFKDINYMPEIFYRLFDEKSDAFRTLDFGYLHTSNGRKDADSRSLDRVFARGIYITKMNRHHLIFNLMVFNIYNEDPTNKDITKRMGYWDLKATVTRIFVHENQSMDLELRAFAGSQLYDINKGAIQTGLIYNFGSENINPAIYFQTFHGYAENLLDYNKSHSEYRLGFLLSY
jgi:outer membrane phospholipase A